MGARRVVKQRPWLELDYIGERAAAGDTCPAEKLPHFWFVFVGFFPLPLPLLWRGSHPELQLSCMYLCVSVVSSLLFVCRLK